MSKIWLEIILIVFLIILNGLLALSELALASARKTKLEQMEKEGDLRASTALKLANSPDSYLSTIQIGITFIGILAGAFGGATIAELLTPYIASVPLMSPYAKAISFTIVVVCITYLSLIVGELIPKRIALNNPEGLARRVAPTINRLSILAHPLVVMLSGTTNMLLRALRFKPKTESTVTEEEIKLLIDKGTQAGTFQEFEQDTIERVFRLADRRVTALMTPRADIVWIDMNESDDEIKSKIANYKFSSYPVARDTLDNVFGVITGKEVLSHLIEGKPFDLKDICHKEMCHKPLFVSEATLAVKTMELLKKSRMHIAFIVDEYGLIQGLVTFSDILRSVFEDVEETGDGERDIIEREDGSLLISGSLPLDEFTDYMETGRLSEEEQAGINTVGGFVMSKLGMVPSVGQHFIWKGLKFEVVDMDSRRVDKILVSRIKDEMHIAS